MQRRSALKDHYLEANRITDIIAGAHFRTLFDYQISTRRQKCLSHSNANRDFCMRQETSSDIRPPAETQLNRWRNLMSFSRCPSAGASFGFGSTRSCSTIPQFDNAKCITSPFTVVQTMEVNLLCEWEFVQLHSIVCMCLIKRFHVWECIDATVLTWGIDYPSNHRIDNLGMK